MVWEVIILCAVLILWGIPTLRCAVKRIILAIKIKKLCKARQFRLYKGLLWFLGGKHGVHSDVEIETSDAIYSVKLFGLPRRRRLLMLEPNGKYFIRNIILMTAFTTQAAVFKIDGKERRMPVYQFCDRGRQKTLHKVLLVHPVTMTIHRRLSHGVELIVRNGDLINGVEIYCLSGFLEHLKNDL